MGDYDGGNMSKGERDMRDAFARVSESVVRLEERIVSLEERTGFPPADGPSDSPHALFHRLWSRSVGSDSYVKADWKRLESILRNAGVLP